MVFGPGRHAKTAGDLADPHSARAGIELLCELLQRGFDLVVALVGKDLLQLFRSHGIIGRINDGFKYRLKFLDFHRSQGVSPAVLLLVMWISSNAFS